jgi:hypothetical protein
MPLNTGFGPSFGSGFSPQGGMQGPPPEMLQQLQRELQTKGLSLNDFKQAVQQYGNPMEAARSLGLYPPAPPNGSPLGGRFGQQGGMQGPPPELVQHLQQELQAKGLTMQDFQQAVQQYGNPMEAGRSLGLTPPSRPLSVG